MAPRYVGVAIAAATVFGVGSYAAGRANEGLPPSWVVAAGRIAGVVLVTLPLALTRRLRWSRALMPFLVFAVIAALIAHQLGARISPRQRLGVAAATVGVVVITYRDREPGVAQSSMCTRRLYEVSWVTACWKA